MKKQHVIALVASIVLIIIIVCIAMTLNGNKSNNKDEKNQNEIAGAEINWDNIKVTAVKFKLKNSTGKDILKMYIRNNRTIEYTDELSGEIKNGEEKEVSYGNYSPYYSWDMKIVFADETEKTLNSFLAANQLYDGSTLELIDLVDTVDAVNHDMGTLLEENNSENVSSESLEQANPEGEETKENQAEKTNNDEYQDEKVTKTDETAQKDEGKSTTGTEKEEEDNN